MTGLIDVETTMVAELLGRGHVMDIGIRPLWSPIPRLVGPAFTVCCPPGDNLMLHAAIYRAAPGSVVVVQAGDVDYAVAGGNVCAVAQRRGIAGFLVDGVIRDVGEVRAMGFPVFARGVMPAPGIKRAVTALNAEVRCGGVTVRGGDLVVADEEGVVVVPAARREQVLADARARTAENAAQSLDDWQQEHQARVDRLLRANGQFQDRR